MVHMTAFDIVDKYIKFFEKREHKKIPNSPLVPKNDPTTLFTSSGMQPLVPYLLGEEHPEGTKLVNVQNVFRAVDIEEVGNNRHTTFFRMLGNWSLGDYFKDREIPWLFEFLTVELKLPIEKLYITVFAGDENAVIKEGKKNPSLSLDADAISYWKKELEKVGANYIVWDEKFENSQNLNTAKIFPYGVDKNWWSRSGPPDKMPAGEPGGPSTEVFYDFGADLKIHEKSKFKDQKCHPNCDCGRFVEIANSVFMQYQKQEDGTLKLLPKPNVDFGGGLERLLLATEDQPDVFKTSLFAPIIEAIKKETGKTYEGHEVQMRIIADHITAATFITNAKIKPSNTDQGYILRRLIRRSLDNLYLLKGKDIDSVIESVVQQYKKTDPEIETNYEEIKNTILEEAQNYHGTREKAKKFIAKKYGDELMGTSEISAEDAFVIYTTHGLSPTQIKSLGYTFDEQQFAERMKEHKDLSKKGAGQKFRGGLADHSQQTVMGHTATHLMHKALRDMFGTDLHQSGSNITSERVRFDFNFDRKLTDEELTELEKIVNDKIKTNLPVHFEMIPTDKAHEMGAIGLFMDTYGEKSKIYFIGGDSKNPEKSYSIEFCGGPHVEFTGEVKSFKIIKQDALGRGFRRIYAKVG